MTISAPNRSTMRRRGADQIRTGGRCLSTSYTYVSLGALLSVVSDRTR